MDFQTVQFAKKVSVNLADSYQAVDWRAIAKPSLTEKEPTPDEQVALLLGKEKERLETEKAALATEKNELTELKQIVLNLIEELENEKSQHIQKLEQEMTSAVLMISEKVVDHELLINPEIIKRAVKSLLDLVNENEKRKIIFGKEDFDFIQKSDASFIQKLNETRGLEVEVREDRPRGNIKVDSLSLNVESNMNKKIEYIWNEISKEQN